jgi:hypothetical protein
MQRRSLDAAHVHSMGADSGVALLASAVMALQPLPDAGAQRARSALLSAILDQAVAMARAARAEADDAAGLPGGCGTPPVLAPERSTAVSQATERRARAPKTASRAPREPPQPLATIPERRIFYAAAAAAAGGLDLMSRLPSRPAASNGNLR